MPRQLGYSWTMVSLVIAEPMVVRSSKFSWVVVTKISLFLYTEMRARYLMKNKLSFANLFYLLEINTL